MRLFSKKSLRHFLIVMALGMAGGCAGMASKPDAENLQKSEAEIAAETAEYERNGDKAYFDSEFETALVQYLLALENKKNDPDLYAKIGAVYRAQRNFNPAEIAFKQALVLSPSHVFAMEGLGMVNLNNKNYAVAHKTFDAVIELQPDRWQSLNALGVIHDMTLKFDLAQGYFKRALEIRPQSAKVMNNLGYSYYLEQKLEEAEVQFKKLIELHPDHSQAWSNLALVYMQKNEISKAKLAFEKTVSEHQALNNIGYIELLNNKSASAKGIFESAIKKSPSYYSVAQQNIASLNSRTVIPEPVPSTKTPYIDDDPENDNAKSDPPVAVASSTPSTTSTSAVAPAKASGAQTHKTRRVKATRAVDHPLLNRENILFLQEKLMTYGFNPGPIDGKLGRKTIRAIRDFQRSNDLPITGRISRTLLDRL